jgi:hypothetical protein
MSQIETAKNPAIKPNYDLCTETILQVNSKSFDPIKINLSRSFGINCLWPLKIILFGMLELYNTSQNI